MVEMGKEGGFRSNFDMPRPFTPRKTNFSAKWQTATVGTRLSLNEN